VSFAVYFLLLVAGGLAVGVLVGVVVRRTSSEGMVPPIVLGIVATLVIGIFVTEFADAHRLVGLPLALTVAAVYVARSGLSDKPASHWIGRDRHGSGDSGDGGGDGGGGD